MIGDLSSLGVVHFFHSQIHVALLLFRLPTWISLIFFPLHLKSEFSWFPRTTWKVKVSCESVFGYEYLNEFFENASTLRNGVSGHETHEASQMLSIYLAFQYSSAKSSWRTFACSKSSLESNMLFYIERPKLNECVATQWKAHYYMNYV